MSAPAVNYRTFVIANPEARAGLVRKEWPLIERLLRASLPELDFAFTEGPAHATLLAREAIKNGWEMIVAVGGDGTLNEVVNGFFEKTDIDRAYRVDDEGWVVAKDNTPRLINDQAVLGLIPMGTGGDFRRTIGLMGGLADTIEHLRGRSTRVIDLGQVGFLDTSGRLTNRLFINIAAAGLSGLVDKHVNSTWKGLGGSASFIWGTFRAFVTWKNIEIQVRLDDTTEYQGPMQNLIVANAEYFGAGMWAAPGAQVDDGQFQVVFMGDLGRRESLQTLPRMYQGSQFISKDIWRKPARRVSARVVGDIPFLLDIDGEAPGSLPATWTIHPQALRLKL